MAKPAWQSLTIQSSFVGITAGAVVVYMIVFVPPETQFKVGNLNFKPADVVSFLSTIGALPASMLAFIGRLKATDAVFTPRNVIGFDQDVALKIEADQAIAVATAAATAIGIPQNIVPQIVQQAVAPVAPVQQTFPITPPLIEEPAYIPAPVVPPLAEPPPIGMTYCPQTFPGFPTIEIVTDTVAKQSTAPSGTLTDKDTAILAPGTWAVRSIQPKIVGETVTEHFEVVFPEPIKGKSAPKNDPNNTVLDVPYYSQRDNVEDYWRTCNTSAHAMLVSYLEPGSIRGDDDYYKRCVAPRGDTTDHAVHTAALEALSISSEWRTNLGYDDLDKQLALGLPVPIGVLHRGSTTSPSGGHILLVIGKQGADSYVCNDPWGEGFDTNYDTNHNGERVVYPKSSLGARWLCGDPHGGWGRIVTG
jgi:hypothetical protein